MRPDADEQALRARIEEALAASGQFWTGDIYICSARTSHADDLIYSSAWDEGITVPGVEKLRIDDRTRTRTAWLPRFRMPLWEASRDWRPAKTETKEDGSPAKGPPVVVWYSFKGGVGRTTALAAFAIQRARDGERVLVIDMDLDAPGAGTLLGPDPSDLPGGEGNASRGVVDYLLEAALGDVQFGDYVHRCKRDRLVGDADGAEIVVMPAGSVDENYLAKLSRLDLEVRGERHPLEEMLVQARDEIEPDWILLDSRAGLSPSAGLLLDGIAHLHVLFGTNSTQSQLGLTQVIRTLGEERIRRDGSQANCFVVQAMVVDVVEVEKAARAQFQTWLESTMRDHYVIVDDEDPEGELWSVRNMDAKMSPSRAIAVPYRARFAFFPSIDDVASDLVEGPYLEIAGRILAQFPSSNKAGDKRGE
ncbi:AAA family ATPase [Polyangium sp. y55x31]|uniref:ParA family protein n=1 Tax=Polyangium sp. y55x31 TaxID=3042688 RepID=UPI002482170D|nr:AAA family ATPase [Polyangium sp. y55x31]MDI1482640.1 AAA family ATPase [Polyangium sp. y55x31]